MQCAVEYIWGYLAICHDSLNHSQELISCKLLLLDTSTVHRHCNVQLLFSNVVFCEFAKSTQSTLGKLGIQ